MIHPEDYIDAIPKSGGGDWSAAFRAMLTDAAVSPTGGGNNRRIGAHIQLRANYDYHFSEALVLNRPHLLSGGGQGASWGNTILSFDPGCKGVVVPFWKHVPYDPEGSIGFGATVENLMILATQGALADGATANDHGFYAEGTYMLRAVRVYGFGGDGFHTNGGAGNNANNWRVDTAHAQNCGRRGWCIYGADANAGLATGLTLTSNCRNAPKWDPNELDIATRYQACGLWDRSFLGNWYFGTHINQSGYPSYVCNHSASGPSVFVGAYEERGGVKSEVDTALMLATNLIPHRSPGKYRLLGAGVSRGTFRHESGDANEFRTVMGEQAGQFLQFFSSARAGPNDSWRWIYDHYYNTLKLHHGGVGPAAFRVTGWHTRILDRKFTPNRLVLDTPVYRGPMPSAVKEQFGPVDARPTAVDCQRGAAGDWALGSRWVNSSATRAGDVVGWRLCVDGDDGAWVWRSEGTLA